MTKPFILLLREDGNISTRRTKPDAYSANQWQAINNTSANREKLRALLASMEAEA